MSEEYKDKNNDEDNDGPSEGMQKFLQDMMRSIGGNTPEKRQINDICENIATKTANSSNSYLFNLQRRLNDMDTASPGLQAITQHNFVEMGRVFADVLAPLENQVLCSVEGATDPGQGQVISSYLHAIHHLFYALNGLNTLTHKAASIAQLAVDSEKERENPRLIESGAASTMCALMVADVAKMFPELGAQVTQLAKAGQVMIDINKPKGEEG